MTVLFNAVFKKRIAINCVICVFNENKYGKH